MKLEDMVMVVENHKGTETNFLLDLTDYMGEVLGLWGDGYVVENIAGRINELYGTKKEKADWSDLYIAANKSIHASFCRSESQLRGFLTGHFNDGEWSFDTERCSKDCLDALRIDITDKRATETRLAGEIQARQGQLEAEGMDFKECMELSKENFVLLRLARKIKKAADKAERREDAVSFTVEMDKEEYKLFSTLIKVQEA